MSINWNLGLSQDVGATFMNAFEAGKQRRQQDEQRNALAAYAQNPNENSLNALAQFDPRFVVEQKRAIVDQQDAQTKAQREQMLVMGQLLDQANDPETYQRGLMAAQRYGIDVSQAPQQFDPNWVAEMRMITRAFNKDGGQQISGIARELVDAGYKPGTPEFEQAIRGVISNKYASEYVDDAGNMRRRSALNLSNQPTTPTSTGPQPGSVVGGYRFKGGNPNDRNSWEQVGGGSGNAAGSFRP